TYIETIKWDYYLKVKEARKSPRYKEMVKNNERVPFIDVFEGLLQIGRERDMEAAFFEIEGPKYLANFFPEIHKELTFLNTWIHEVLQRRSLSDPNDNPEMQIDTSPSLNWRGSTIELVELIKALIEARKLPDLADKEIFKLLEKYLGYPIDQREKLQTIKKRTKDQTKFIDTLQYAMQSWIERD
ncbi:MAG: RteC domain-containing protein, partial [Maribacter sp.]|nr:RteC domain-containing protein [Maribacter sp.]